MKWTKKLFVLQREMREASEIYVVGFTRNDCCDNVRLLPLPAEIPTIQPQFQSWGSKLLPVCLCVCVCVCVRARECPLGNMCKIQFMIMVKKTSHLFCYASIKEEQDCVCK